MPALVDPGERTSEGDSDQFVGSVGPYTQALRFLSHTSLEFMRVVLAPLYRGLLNVGVYISPRRKVLGFWVATFERKGGVSTSAFEKVQEALELVSEVDALTFKRIEQYIRRIVVCGWTVPGSFAGAYVGRSATCFLSPELLEKGAPGDIARAIVHEMTHARIGPRGSGGTLAARARREVVAVRAEINFARKLSVSEQLLATLEELRSTWKTVAEQGRTELNTSRTASVRSP